MNHRPLLYSVLVLLILAWAACGGSGTETSSDTPATTQEDGLSPAELENGIGPIKTIELPPAIDAALAAQGETIFATKCATCHKLDQRYVGPPLGQVLSRRKPTYVMNMMLNPDEMVKRHPEAKALLAQYLTPMPNQNLTEDDARAVLEYLRDNQIEATGTAQ